MRRIRSGRPYAILLALGLFMLVSLTAFNYLVSSRSIGTNAFLPRWLAAKAWLLEGSNPYEEQVSLDAQRMFYGRPAEPQAGEDLGLFLYPLPAMLFYAPFAWLPYEVAMACWMTLLELSLPAITSISLYMVNWKPKLWLVGVLLVFSIIWYHGLRSVANGDLAPIEALFLAVALLAVHLKLDWLAGPLLGFSLAVPQMSLLLILFVILWGWSQKRWALVGWSMASMVAVLALSFIVLPGWHIGWLRQVLAFLRATPVQLPVVAAKGLSPVFAPYVSGALIVALCVFMIWHWALGWGKGDRWFLWNASATLAVSNLVLMPTTTTNFVSLLPAFCVVFFVWAQRWKIGGTLAIMLSLSALLALPWGRFLLERDGDVEAWWLFLLAPLLALFGLWWTRWWFTRASGTDSEETPAG